MLPAMAASIAASSGCGFLASNAAAAMIWPELTIPALHDLEVVPRLLHLLTGLSLPDGLDGRDGASLHEPDRQDAGTDGPSVDMDGTGPALGDAASELGAGETEMIAQHP